MDLRESLVLSPYKALCPGSFNIVLGPLYRCWILCLYKFFGSCVFSAGSWVTGVHRILGRRSRVLLGPWVLGAYIVLGHHLLVWLELPKWSEEGSRRGKEDFVIKLVLKKFEISWFDISGLVASQKSFRIKTKFILPTRGYFFIETCMSLASNTAYKRKFSIKNFFDKCCQIPRKYQFVDIW